MNNSLSTEFYWLTITLILSAILWMPYILNRMAEHGIWPALYNSDPDAPPTAAWATRMMRAHENAIENLVIFAPLVIMVEVVGANTALTASVCMIYFFARLAHVLIYSARVPLLRTIAFLVGFVCQIVLAWTLLQV